MNRGKKAAYNSAASLFSEVVAIICGFILPRLILNNFGSTYNGLTQSVSQFLSIIALLRAGVGGATRAALYKSLANEDTNQISATIKATEIFMKRVALIFATFVVAFSAIYPLAVRNEFGWIFSASLVLIISISTFVQYYFGITYQMLLQADQRQYITSISSAGTTILNTFISVILINSGLGIHVVKLGSAAAYCIAPLIINFYAKRYYHIDESVKPDFSSINQRWDAMFHQVAGFIYSNTDVMLITIFCNLKEVSVYTTYCLVSNGLKRLMATVTSGVEAAFGDMLARKDEKILVDNVRVYETLLHSAVCVIFGSAIVLITPFISVYTRGINDINYSRNLFGYILIITEAIHLLRQPYHSIVEAAGHYKQTKRIAMIQALLNLGSSLILINLFELIGVITGTLISDIYRGIAYRIYVSKNIINDIKIADHVKRLCITALTMFLVFLCSKIWPNYNVENYLSWIIYAIEITALSGAITLIIEAVFYRSELKELRLKLRSIAKGIIHR